MATIKEVIDNYLAEGNLPQYATYVGNNDPGAKQCLALLKKVCDALRNMSLNWPQLKRKEIFTTVTGETKYRLVGDFYRLLLGSQWDSSNQRQMRGPLTDSQQALRQYSVFATTTLKGYQLSGPTEHLFSTAPYSQRSAGYFNLDQPGQNDTDELVYGYISCNYIWPRDWVTATPYVIGDIRSGDGYVYIALTNGNSGATRPDWSSGSASDGGVTWGVYKEPYLITTKNTKLNDEDLVLFDESLVIQGFQWALLASKGLDYAQARFDWENMAKGSHARFNGPVKVNMCGGDLEDYDDFLNTPDGSWPA